MLSGNCINGKVGFVSYWTGEYLCIQGSPQNIKNINRKYSRRFRGRVLHIQDNMRILTFIGKSSTSSDVLVNKKYFRFLCSLDLHYQIKVMNFYLAMIYSTGDHYCLIESYKFYALHPKTKRDP